VAGRDAREARTLGLWTASWLALLLLAGLLWVGDVAVQWPVLVIPAIWALVALRPRRGNRVRPRGWENVTGPGRTDTVERPALRVRPDRRGDLG
jgi:hypothetical protein